MQTSAGKITAIEHCDSEEVEFLKERATANSERCVQALRNLQHRTRRFPPNVNLNQDTHATWKHQTAERSAHEEGNWNNGVDHSPSPFSAPSDFQNFVSLKDTLLGRCFAGDNMSEGLSSVIKLFTANYEGHLESNERFAIQRYLLIIGKKQNMQVLSHTFTYFST